jgi:hypothetical protein
MIVDHARIALLCLAATSLAALGACGDDHAHGHTHADESVAEELCEHMADGPAQALTAVATQDSTDGPTISDDHVRYDITLIAVDGGNGGAVTFAAGAAGHHAIALGADIELQAFDAAGVEIAPHHRNTGSAICEEVAADLGFELAVGTTTFVFGPTEATEVSVVIELDADQTTHLD